MQLLKGIKSNEIVSVKRKPLVWEKAFLFGTAVLATATFPLTVKAAILQLEENTGHQYRNNKGQPQSVDIVLTGAKDVSVNGKLYDVEFSEGTYNSVIGSAGPLFTTKSDALAAKDALLNQVLIGDYDTNPGWVLGCEWYDRCRIITAFDHSEELFGGLWLSNVTYDGDYFNTYYSYHNAETPSYDTFTRWSIAASVPEPSSYALMVAGLMLVAGVRKHRV